ncbi:MAG: hypothetical protein J6X40_05895 [Bacteroidales bacterium]|nr:hypothetical protein [Bacteroidales bacterium]
MKRFFLIMIGFAMALSSCRQENPISDDPSHRLQFSVDTVLFDTVFTSLGSSTHHLVLYNPYPQDLMISEVRLMGGEQSRFKINLDGDPGTEFHDKILPANDSLYTFLTVTIDPTDANTPFVVEDSLLFVTNGNVQQIKLVAWGQNARYIVGDQTVSVLRYPYTIVADSLETSHWTNELPYVIYGYALINSWGTLHIHEGTHIHIHDKSGIVSWSEGQLIVEGTATQPVVIEGDRLEGAFQDEPGQWDRIWLQECRPGADHRIEHAIIRNGYIGVQAESFLKATQAALRLNNCIIENHTGMGLYALYYAIEANNLVVDNCGQYACAVQIGGDYVFRHCTFGNYWWKSVRTNPTLVFNNYYDDEEQRNEFPFHFEMGNSIVYGVSKNEFVTDLSGQTVDTTYLFDHCLIKTETFQGTSPGFNTCLFNQDPLFKDARNFDFHLSDVLSPAVGSGNPVIATQVPYDLEGTNRLGTPDLGAYQY